MKFEKLYLVVLFLMGICINGSVFAYSGGDGTSGNPYKIANKADLLELGATTADYESCFVLVADINLAGDVFTQPIIAPDTDNLTEDFQGQTFNGVINGNGFAIRNLTINAPTKDYIGLIGRLHGYRIGGGLVKNLYLEDVNIVGKNSVGALTGNLYNWAAKVENCGVTGKVEGYFSVGGLIGAKTGGSETTVLKCFAEVAVSGNEQVGGLVGLNREGLIQYSYANAVVTGSLRVGALAGRNFFGTISNCYALGQVNASQMFGGLIGENENTVTKTYAAVVVEGGSHLVGGLVGFGNSANVTNSFWDTDVSNQSSSQGGTGWGTAAMKDIQTFLNAGWDFVDETENGTEDLWTICSGISYPMLSWQPLFNDQMSGAAEIPLGQIISATSSGATGSDITLMGYADSADVWFYFDCEQTGKNTITLESDAFDTTLAVFDAAGKEIIFNDDFFGDKSVVILKAAAGKTYYIRIAGYDGQTGAFTRLAENGAVQAIQGDLNYDGFVTLVDFAIMAQNWLIGQ